MCDSNYIKNKINLTIGACNNVKYQDVITILLSKGERQNINQPNGKLIIKMSFRH